MSAQLATICGGRLIELLQAEFAHCLLAGATNRITLTIDVTPVPKHDYVQFYATIGSTRVGRPAVVEAMVPTGGD